MARDLQNHQCLHVTRAEYVLSSVHTRPRVLHTDQKPRPPVCDVEEEEIAAWTEGFRNEETGGFGEVVERDEEKDDTSEGRRRQRHEQ